MESELIPLCRNNCCPSLFITQGEKGPLFVLKEGDICLSLSEQHLDAITKAFLNWRSANDPN